MKSFCIRQMNYLPEIGKHINNVFSEGELDKRVVVAKFATTTQHGAIKGKIQMYFKLEVPKWNLKLGRHKIPSVGFH